VALKIGEKRIFFGLSFLSLLALTLAVLLLWYLISPRLRQIHPVLPLLAALGFGIFVSVVVGGLILLFLTSITERDFLFPHGKKQITVKVLFPIVTWLGALLGISKERVREPFVEVNNSLVRATKRRIVDGKVLLLLPHCLQNFECPYRVTSTFANCRRCGKCPIGDLIDLADTYKADIAIATGGTLARKVVVDKRPSAIVAVACERDIVPGIQETYPIPVLGVLNQRPNGPCFNTSVDLNKVEEALRFLSGKDEDRDNH
jgi:hypothetical protein